MASHKLAEKYEPKVVVIMNKDAKEVATATHVDADYSLEAVPKSARKGFWNMFFVMLGFTFFSASMSVGAKLGNGLDLSGFFGACLIGGVILSAYCGVYGSALSQNLWLKRLLSVLCDLGLHPDWLVRSGCCHVFHSCRRIAGRQ